MILLRFDLVVVCYCVALPLTQRLNSSSLCGSLILPYILVLFELSILKDNFFCKFCLVVGTKIKLIADKSVIGVIENETTNQMGQLLGVGGFVVICQHIGDCLSLYIHMVVDVWDSLLLLHTHAYLSFYIGNILCHRYFFNEFFLAFKNKLMRHFKQLYTNGVLFFCHLVVGQRLLL